MRVYVNDEERELVVIDRESGKNYANMVVCSQERLDKNEFGDFVMTEEEYADWQKTLATLQEAEDMRVTIQDRVVAQELDDYLYEETKYLTNVKETADMEKLSLTDLCRALQEKNLSWLKENHFFKTMKKLD